MEKNSPFTISRYPEMIIVPVWLIINLFQAVYTELSPDEAYYWMYSRFPEWGYFDHPPMVAFFIRIGYALFENELGVRLLTVLSQVATLIILWSLIKHSSKEKHRIVFWLIAASIPVFQIYGFITTPDVPMLFFGALFFLAYSFFYKKPTLLNALLFGATMAGLLYSKYHGILLIFFTLLSNLRLLRSPLFYFASFVGILLLLPHFFWHIKHDFPSIYYHFYWRASEFHFSQVVEYLLSQIFILNPILLILIFLSGYIMRLRSADLLERAMAFNLSGITLFFFIFSFRSRIEAHWTLLVSLPLIYIGFISWINYEGKFRNYFIRSISIIALLLLLSRGVLLFNILPVKNDFHNTDKAMKMLKSKVGSANVVFSSSYQKASLYSFYNKTFAHSMNSIYYRKNQFDIWRIEKKFNQQPVVMISGNSINNLESKQLVLPDRDTLYMTSLDPYVSVQGLRFSLPLIDTPCVRKSSFTLPLMLHNDYSFPVDLSRIYEKIICSAYFCKFGHIASVAEAKLEYTATQLDAGQAMPVTISVLLPDTTGVYNLGLSLHLKNLPPTFNSNLTLITIE